VEVEGEVDSEGEGEGEPEREREREMERERERAGGKWASGGREQLEAGREGGGGQERTTSVCSIHRNPKMTYTAL
jgi:hypothetical protein